MGVLEGQTYAVSAYLAILAALLILGRPRRLLRPAERVRDRPRGFGIASVLCGIAPTLELLVVFRLLQGAAGALLVPGSLAILTALFEGEARARAFGIWASATSGRPSSGRWSAGSSSIRVSWRVAFLINVPLVVLALWATVRHMPETRAEGASGRFDWLGAAGRGVAVGGLAFGAIRGQDRQWQDPLPGSRSPSASSPSSRSRSSWRRRPNPLVPLGLFRRRPFATINLSTLLIYGALYTIFVFQGLLLQNTLGYSATAAGVIGLPTGILLTLLSTRFGALAGRIGARRFLVIGPLLDGGRAALAAPAFPADSEPWPLALGDPSTLIASARPSSTSCRRSCCSGSGSRSSWRRSPRR